jgi:hypothetical protein
MVLPSLPECAAVVDRLAPMLLDAAIRSFIVLGIAGLGAAAMRRASAAARHWVWLLGLAGMLLVPILSATLPIWRVLPRLGTSQTGAFPLASAIVQVPACRCPQSPRWS